MSKHQISGLNLYDRSNRRLYINRAERTRFLNVARTRAAPIAAFALTLAYTGCRLSEARFLTTRDLQPETRTLSIRCLKKRDKHVIREIPIPFELVRILLSIAPNDEGGYFWPSGMAPVSRIRAYRWIKSIMAEAGIVGAQACPKGLRHGFGIHATLAGVQLHMLQRWMGHSSISTTAIYATVVGPEERKLAEKMWRETEPRSEEAREF